MIFIVDFESIKQNKDSVPYSKLLANAQITLQSLYMVKVFIIINFILFFYLVSSILY